MNKLFDVIVNPFTRAVNISKDNFSLDVYFSELDEWHSFEIDGQLYDAHFLYDDKFSFNIYKVNKDNHNDYKQCLINKIQILNK